MSPTDSPRAELQLVAGEVDRGRAEVRARDLERDARPGRVLPKQEADGAALEQPVRLPLLLFRLQVVGEVENGIELRRRPVADARERTAAQIEGESRREHQVSPSR